MPSERLKRIIQENAEFEKASPYNFCDRWCERCPHQTQARCTLYQDELERKLTCIAHGRDENDPEVTEEVLHWQFDSLEEKLKENLSEEDLEEIDLEAIDDPAWEPIKKHIRFVEENSFSQTAEQYRKKAYLFLQKTFYCNKEISHDLAYDFEIINWYHTLLPVKLQRALAGFHEPMAEGDISLQDAMAQFAICKKAIRLSTEAFKKLIKIFPDDQLMIGELIALLQNILSRIEMIEETI